MRSCNNLFGGGADLTNTQARSGLGMVRVAWNASRRRLSRESDSVAGRAGYSRDRSVFSNGREIPDAAGARSARGIPVWRGCRPADFRAFRIQGAPPFG